ncbi:MULTISPECIES: hypothetical protein [Sphingobium]|jgi:hypothetical protein|uniref:TrbI/VirB10 family protein n=3 Tax=Sphingobium fuliginis (strain ATCC 27551) TaxID=336203 RepID=A0A292ZL45_SPHSA|nr:MULTISPECIES: hypothetical protein [Sphingobium]OAP29477.1 hypothetical protein A8O16_23380 [Sphingobium sp. 20006FA]AJR23773.1 hypothetical protein TZ53_08610 [Sphingobium sp. YBL2]KXU32603.1 hypothetical protein AXW74_06065 [Sphingobium sp. AM]KYC32680.1 hypothetical protein A0J57_08570 [Sphingobium sp. 22B]PNP97272.1 hypothetical protein A8G00_22295 [Sphingobium sp. SA916]
MIRLSLPMRSAIPLLLAASAGPALAQSTILPEGMAIQLETRQEISSKSARVGDRIELAVAKPVTIGGVTLIPAGSPAVGEVSRVRDNGLLGRSGKLDIKVSTVRAGGMDVPVRGQRNSQGKSGTLGAVGAGIVFLPLAVIVRGKDVKLPAGTLFEVYVDKEVSLGSGVAPGGPAAATPAESRDMPGSIRTVDPNQALGS